MATRTRSSPRSSNSRSGFNAKNEILGMLKGDHRKVKKAFKEFEKLDPQEDRETCEALVQQTLAEIEVHAQLEEQIFYPAVRGAIDEQDLIDEAEVEHMTAKVLIEQLKAMDAEDEKFAATFKVLGEYIDHHVKEEEGQMFKKLTASGAEWDSVLEEMQAQRMQLMEEKGLPAEDEQAESADRAQGSRRAALPSGARRGEAEARPQAKASSRKTPSSEKD